MINRILDQWIEFCRLNKSISKNTCYHYFVDENGIDRMKEMIKENYDRIKAEAKQIVTDELERIRNDENLRHLLPKEEK